MRPRAATKPKLRAVNGGASAQIDGRWKLLRKLGEGGSAQVFEGEHRDGTRAALKLLRPELAAEPRALERFQREGFIMSQVRHDGVVRLLGDDRTEDGTPFLVLELLRGRTLAQHLAARPQGRLAVMESIRIGLAALDILDAVHAAGIVHRDVKPENFFLGEDGALKLFDFGIARFEKAPKKHATWLGVAMGTPGYMASEQAWGRWDEVDARSDVFAVGAVLFRLITGTCVHGTGSVTKVLGAAMCGRVPSLRDRVPGIDQNLSHVIDRALRADPEERWPDARAMREALARAERELLAR